MLYASRTSIESRHARNASILTWVLIVASIPAAALFAHTGYSNRISQLYVPAAALIARAIFDFIPLTLIRRGRTSLAMTLVMVTFVLNGLMVTFIVQGLGLVIALAIGLVVLSISVLTLPAKYTNAGLVIGVVFSILALALDNILGAERARLPELQRLAPFIVAGMAAPYILVVTREFRRFNLQTKITLGIMITGGFAVSVISFFSVVQAGRITDLLAGRLETNVRLSAEESLANTVHQEAGAADAFFADIAKKTDSLAAYRAALQDRRDTLGLGSYWNASQSLIQLEGGQYGNSAQDQSSVFVPITLPLDEAILVELNTSAYLDFSAPQEIRQNPDILAIYAVDKRGIIRYYPNVELASLLPPDFDVTRRPYYEIAAPALNPDRIARWSVPYVDAAGGGLVVTVASPVYYDNEFNGIIAADLQLSAITEHLSSVTVGQSGFAFMVDDAGRMIYMPPAGYEIFGIDPAELIPEEFDKYSVLGKGSAELQSITNRMVTGDSGLETAQINDAETYISFAPVPSNGYSLALVVPVSEMQSAILATQIETQRQLRAAIQTALLILASTFLGALFVSILLGQLIASPIRSLTGTANLLAGGDFTARSNIASDDETGTLAQSFNTMAQTLNETLLSLEDRIRERTVEVERISQVNAYRASRLEAITRISRTIGSTQTLETLLPQIAETISMELGFYHAGIFLLDSQKEYAVLAAASSEGGKRMLARSHRLLVGETGIVGYATRSGEPRIALDTGRDAAYFNNPELPDTRSEIALPLRVGNQVIGALDVQSRETNAFSQEDINVLSILADQVAIAIQNSRSYQQSLEALQQAKQTAAQLGEQQWNQFITRQPPSGFHFDGVNTLPLKPGQAANPNSLEIPILLRGVRIGSLRLSAPNPDHAWDESEIALAQAAAERTALAIETARLLEEAQKRAAKERAIGQITAKIGSLVNIENIVQTTVQELGGTLPGTDVAIQFISAKTGHTP